MDVAGVPVDKEALAAVCRRYGVARLEVFGSVGRNDARPDSDIDVLYELAPEARLGWRIEDLADELSATLGRRVDLVSRNAPASAPANYSAAPSTGSNSMRCRRTSAPRWCVSTS